MNTPPVTPAAPTTPAVPGPATPPAALTPPATPAVLTPPPVPDPAPTLEPTGSDSEPADLAAEVAKWKAFSRKHEDSAKANADKAKKFDEFEEASKTELQKAADRATAAEAKFAESEARAMRAEVAAAKGIPATLLSGSTQEELEASADALIAFKGAAAKPDFGAGDRGNDVGAKKQMTLSEMQALYASKDYAAIETARTEGRLTTVLGG